jgi:hypothetical protein
MTDNGRVLAVLPVLIALAATSLELSIGTPTPDAGSKATFTFVRVVEDSRCPKGVQCVWEGDATVELRVSPEQGEPETVQLHLNATTATNVVVRGLRIVLERLDPYPESGRSTDSSAYRAVIALTHE